MKIIIDLDEKYYNDIKNSPTASNYSTLYALFGIRNGTPLEAELEKIKAEIDEIVEREMEESQFWSLGLRYSKKIIDNHIKELKGETE